jgi:hypothetical protein
MPLSLAEFVERWKAVTLTERAAAQSHFIASAKCAISIEQHASILKDGRGYAKAWNSGYSFRTCSAG